jgi:hypothetical protein
MGTDPIPDYSHLTGIPCAHLDVADSQPYNTQEFQAIVGSLLYCSTSTRPDIARAMSIVCSKASAPTYGDWRAALRILQFLRSTCDVGIQFTTPTNRDASGIVLTAYADSSLAPDWQQGDGYSVTGYVLYLCGGPLLWHSAKQTAVAKSTGESEFRALSACTSDVVWLRGLLNELGFPQSQPTLVYEDNQGTLGMATAELLTRRTRGIVLECCYVRDALRRGIIRPYFCPSTQMLADGLTKILGRVLFESHWLPLLGYAVHPAVSSPFVWSGQK